MHFCLVDRSPTDRSDILHSGSSKAGDEVIGNSRAPSYLVGKPARHLAAARPSISLVLWIPVLCGNLPLLLRPNAPCSYTRYVRDVKNLMDRIAIGLGQRNELIPNHRRRTSTPPVSEKRLFLTARGEIGYTLKTPYRDGTTHFIFEPLDFIARLAALVPPPRLNLTRFHGVFAPNSPYRARITPARRGRGGKPRRPQPLEDRTPAEQRSAMRWAKRLKRVFRIDVETCPKCGGTVQIIASIEDPPVIERILNHLAKNDLPGLWPDSRAPPGTGRPAERPGLHH